MTRISIPISHEAITLGQVMRYNHVNTSPIEVVKTFCSGDLNELSLPECEKIAATLNEMLEDGHAVIQPFVDIDGITFGLHPDLYYLTVGEMTDLIEYTKDPIMTAHKAMAILYRPITVRIGKQYEIERYDKRHQDLADRLKSLPYHVYRGAIAFFLTIRETSMSNMNKYSDQLLLSQMENLKELKQILSEQSGDGTIQ